jgi:FAD/FMN-containing dehydrogenase
MLEEATVGEFRAGLRGSVLRPGDAGYDEARLIHNGMFDRRPALIARCLGTADIVDAVRFARTHDLELAIRGGGHNTAGKSVCDGGLMLDLSLMKGIHVDPRNRTLRAQAGATWGDFNRETQLHGLATTGGVVSTTGIAGLTLGGGVGWLMGKHGLTADNLICAEVVTATGDVLHASADENPDLFWGLRGGGGNFGVVSWFEYRLHPVGPVTSGLVGYPIDRARHVLRFARELLASAPDELTLHVGVSHAPDGSGVPLAVILACHCGSLDDGEAALRPIRRLGSPAVDTLGPASYVDTNTKIYDPAWPRGARSYWKSNFIPELSDAVIDVLIAQFALCPSPMSGALFEHLHGAVTRVGVGDTAFPQRADSLTGLVASQWLDPRDDERNIAWARDTHAALRPFMVRESYVNYLADDESRTTIEQAYGPNYERLVALKKRMDPTNFFHTNQNVRLTS